MIVVGDPFVPTGHDPRMPMWELWETDSDGALVNLLQVSTVRMSAEKSTDVVLRRWWIPASKAEEVSRG